MHLQNISILRGRLVDLARVAVMLDYFALPQNVKSDRICLGCCLIKYLSAGSFLTLRVGGGRGIMAPVRQGELEAPTHGLLYVGVHDQPFETSSNYTPDT